VSLPGKGVGSTDGVRSVERAASIMRTLADQRAPLPVGELAAEMNLHPATVHRLLGTLVRAGWLDQNPTTSRYRLGIKLLGLGAVALAANPLMQHGKDSLRRLTEVSDCTSYLSLLIGKRVVYLARHAGKLGMTLDFEAGHTQPAYTTADGKLLLAYLSKSERAKLFARSGFQKYTDKTVTDLDELEAELEKIKACGHAVDQGERWDFLRGVAVPVFGADETVIAGLSCYGRMEITTELENRLSQEMLILAEDLSHRVSVS
jgi:DNA-binding IclR family transcriptional regulator